MGDACQKAENHRQMLADRDAKINELSPKVQLLAYGTENVASFQAQVAAWDVVLTAMRVTALPSTRALRAIVRNHASLQLELDALHTSEAQRVGVMLDF